MRDAYIYGEDDYAVLCSCLDQIVASRLSGHINQAYMAGSRVLATRIGPYYLS